MARSKPSSLATPIKQSSDRLGVMPSRQQLKAMAGIELKPNGIVMQLPVVRTHHSYFGNFNVHSTKISSAAEHKDYSSLISFDDTTTKDDLENELVRLIGTISRW